MIMTRFFPGKIHYFGHIKRHDCLENTIMEGLITKKMDAGYRGPPEYDTHRGRKIGAKSARASKSCDEPCPDMLHDDADVDESHAVNSTQ